MHTRTHGLALPGWQAWGAVLTPALLALAYPPLGLSTAAWLGLAPLIVLLRSGQAGVGRWVALGWGFGLVHAVILFRWMPRALLEVGGVPTHVFMAFAVAMSLGYALGPAAACGLSRGAWLRWRVDPAWGLPLLLALLDAAQGVAPFGGMPWGSLAATQTSSVAAHILVPLAGGSALVLAIGLVNGMWAVAAARPRRSGAWAWWPLAAMALLTAVLAGPWPAAHARSEADMPGAWRALLVASAVTPGAAPAEVARAGDVRDYLGRTLHALETLPSADGPQRHEHRRLLVVWPESAAREPVEHGKTLVLLGEALELWGADLLLGSDAADMGATYNSVYLLRGRPFDFARYDKRALVPFGEYVPRGFRWLLPAKVTAGADDYAEGTAPPVLRWDEDALGVAICFESILPGHMRSAVRAGADVIAVLANDTWLTPSAATHHLQLTALEGLAVGRDVLFVANGGWRAHLADGRAVALSPSGGEPLLVGPRGRSGQTPWVRWGYLPLAALMGLTAAAGALATRWGGPPGRRG